MSCAILVAGASGTGRNRNRGRSGDAPLLFQQLRQIRRFQDGQLRQVIDDLLQVSHLSLPMRFEPVGFACPEPSGRGTLGGVGLDHARDLGRGSVGELGDLGRRRDEQADDLGAQFIQ